MKTVITEGIFDIKSRKSIRTAIFEYKNDEITRKLFILGDSEKRNNKVDVINHFQISLKEIKTLSSKNLGLRLKKQFINVNMV